MRTTTVRITNGRRRFLRDLSLLGGAAMLSPGGLFETKTAGAQEESVPPSAPTVHTERKTEGGRGSSMRVSDEIMEYQDEETGARVRLLTGDGSDNVHLYFTSESFLAGPANRLVFASNRSGRLFYFGGPALRAVALDTLGDRELYLVPGSTQHSHGHPVFSLDDRWALYNSMISPAHNVYMADVHSLA